MFTLIALALAGAQSGGLRDLRLALAAGVELPSLRAQSVEDEDLAQLQRAGFGHVAAPFGQVSFEDFERVRRAGLRLEVRDVRLPLSGRLPSELGRTLVSFPAIPTPAELREFRGAMPDATIGVPIQWAAPPPPLPDANVVYEAGFSIPPEITDPAPHSEVSFPYPSSPSVVSALYGKTDDAKLRARLRDFGEARWNADRIGTLLRPLQNWARKNRVPVQLRFHGRATERTRAFRDQWARDVRQAAEDARFGWTYVGYLDPEGPFVGAVGDRSAKGGLLGALFGK